MLAEQNKAKARRDKDNF